MRRSNTIIFLVCLLSCAAGRLISQQVLIDRGLQANGLWCFPLYTDSETYLYLPPRARLALDQDSLPKFSYMRYVFEKQRAASGPNTINEAAGGGILHFLVLYDTPAKQIQKAQDEIRKRLNNDDVKIRGPVVFESGRYALISSILNPQNGKQERKLIGAGEAPVLENSRIALSFDVKPMRSKLLLESFKMATPDVSLVFEMTFSGLTEAYEAELEIDWSEVQKSQTFGAGGSIYFVSADVELGFEEMRKNNAIKLTTVGSSESLEGLLNTVYGKLLELMFDPVEPSQVPDDQRGGLEDALAAMIGPNGMLGSSNTTGFGAHVGYQLKMMNSSGKGHLTFHGRSNVLRKHYITFNVGNLYHKYGKNEKIFRDVPLWDPAFQQREVYVGIDGKLQREFDRMVNSVTVRLKKQHENQEQTAKELLINRKVFLDSLGKLSMIYLNRGDQDRLKWLNYDFQAVWQFTGGGSFTTDWKQETASMINLYTPFRRRRIDLDGDLKMLAEKGVRAISVKIEYPFFDQQKEERITIRPGDDLDKKSFEITLPVNEETVSYTVTWIKNDRSRVSITGKDQYGLIFIDEMPDL